MRKAVCLIEGRDLVPDHLLFPVLGNEQAAGIRLRSLGHHQPDIETADDLIRRLLLIAYMVHFVDSEGGVSQRLIAHRHDFADDEVRNRIFIGDLIDGVVGR